MATGATFVDVQRKRLLGTEDFGSRLLGHMRTLVQESYEKSFRTGCIYDTALGFTGGTDKFSITGSSEATDGQGHLLDVAGAGYASDINFENALGIDYEVGLHYAEIPNGLQINPRSGLPEYISHEETVGESADPNSVADMTTYLSLVVDSVCESGVSHAGRQCLVYMKEPAKNATLESVAVQIRTVYWSGGQNKIDTADLMGQDTPSTTASDYTVVLLGPTVRRNTALLGTDGYAFVGVVTGVGSGGTPTAFDTTEQDVLSASLSDLQDITSRNATTDRLKVDVKSYSGDVSDPQIAVRNPGGSIVFQVDGNGNVQIEGTTTQENHVQVNSTETITDNLTAGDAATDTHRIVGTWQHEPAGGGVPYFKVDGATGSIGINTEPEADWPLSINRKTKLTAAFRQEQTFLQQNYRETDLAIDAGGLWRMLLSAGNINWQKNTHATSEFGTSTTYLRFNHGLNSVQALTLLPMSSSQDLGSASYPWNQAWIYGDVEIGNADTDLHTHKGTIHITDTAGTAYRFRVDGSSGRVGIGKAPETSAVESMLANLAIEGHTRLTNGDLRIQSTLPSLELRETDYSVTAGGLWRIAVNTTDMVFERNTWADGSFLTRHIWLRFDYGTSEALWAANVMPSGTRNLGSASNQWTNLWIDGTADIDVLTLSTTASEGLGSHLYPTATDTYTIGLDATRRFQGIYTRDLYLGDTDGQGVGTHLKPTGDAAYDLGSVGRRWNNLYVQNLSFSGDFLPASDNGQDIGSPSLRWAEGHFGTKFQLGTTGSGGFGAATPTMILKHSGATDPVSSTHVMLDIYPTWTTAQATQNRFSIYARHETRNATQTSGGFFLQNRNVDAYATSHTVSSVIGAYLRATAEDGITCPNLWGLQISAEHDAIGGSVIYGIENELKIGTLDPSSGSTAYGQYTNVTMTAGSTWTNLYGTRIDMPSAGTVTTKYALYVDGVTGATNNYGLYIGSCTDYALYTTGGKWRVGGDVEVSISLNHDLGTSSGRFSSIYAGRMNLAWLDAATTSLKGIIGQFSNTSSVITAGRGIEITFTSRNFQAESIGGIIGARTEHTSGTLPTLSGVQGWVQNSGSSTLTDGRCFRAIGSTHTGTVTSISGYYVDALNASTNTYGLYVSGQTSATNNYAIYTNAGIVRFGDNMSIAGSITPTANGSYDLGTSSFRWDEIYAREVDVSIAESDRTAAVPISGAWFQDVAVTAARQASRGTSTTYLAATNELMGGNFGVVVSGASGDLTAVSPDEACGVRSFINCQTGASFDYYAGFKATFRGASTGMAATAYYGYLVQAPEWVSTPSSPVGGYYGLYVEDLYNASRSTTTYGVYVAAQGGSQYSIYTNAGLVRLGGDVTVAGDINPSTGDTYDMGTSSARWNQLWANRLEIATSKTYGSSTYWHNRITANFTGALTTYTHFGNTIQGIFAATSNSTANVLTGTQMYSGWAMPAAYTCSVSEWNGIEVYMSRGSNMGNVTIAEADYIRIVNSVTGGIITEMRGLHVEGFSGAQAGNNFAIKTDGSTNKVQFAGPTTVLNTVTADRFISDTYLEDPASSAELAQLNKDNAVTCAVRVSAAGAILGRSWNVSSITKGATGYYTILTSIEIGGTESYQIWMASGGETGAGTAANHIGIIGTGTGDAYVLTQQWGGGTDQDNIFSAICVGCYG